MRTVRLFINGKEVGTVAPRNSADSWGMGEFTPNDAFSEFAPLFGGWSLIMHDDDGGRRLDAAMQDELHRAEAELDCQQRLGQGLWLANAVSHDPGQRSVHTPRSPQQPGSRQQPSTGP